MANYQNQTLIEVMQAQDFTAKAEASAALNAIILASKKKENENSLRQAVINHQNFWENLGVEFDDAAPENANFLHFDGHGGGMMGYGANVQNNFNAIYQLAAQKRLEIALANAGIADLDGLIGENNKVEIRRKLIDNAGNLRFGGRLGPIPDWDAATQSILTDDACAKIQQKAQPLFLIKKISECNDKGILDRFLTSQVPYNEANFKDALQNGLGISATAAENIAFFKEYLYDEYPKLNALAAKRGMELRIQNMTPQELFTIGEASKNHNNAANFATNFPRDVCAAKLSNDDALILKGQLHARYLPVYFSTKGPADHDYLAAIAAATDVNGVITAIDGTSPAWLTNAVTQGNLLDIRKAAANQALKLKISQLSDDTVLDAILAANNNQDLSDILASRAALGYNANESFRNACANLNLQEIKAVAQARKDLIAANNDAQLLAIFSDVNQFRELRKEALLGYIKSQMANPAITDPQLANIINAADVGALNTAVQALNNSLLPINISDLHAGNADVNIGFAQQMRALAAAEEEVREQRTLFANGTFVNDIVAKINTVGATRALLQTLPENEKRAHQARLAEVLATGSPPAQQQDLVAIATAENVANFKTALDGFGLNANAKDWATVESIKPVQLAACKTALSNQVMMNLFPYADNHRPELKNLVTNLPLEKQQQLLQRPDVLKALATAKEAEQLRFILGDSSLTTPAVANLIKENKRLSLLSEIENAEIAKCLATQIPPIELTRQQVNAINRIIRGSVFDNTGVPPRYVTKIKLICDQITADPAQRVQKANDIFGVDYNANTITAGNIQTAVRQQQQHNAYLRGLDDNNLTAGEKAAKHVCLRFSKQNAFTQQDFDEFKADITNSASFDAFFESATTAARGYLAKLNPSLDNQMTKEDFSMIKSAINQQKFFQNHPQTVEQALSTAEQALKALKDKTDALKEQLSGTSSFFGNLTGSSVDARLKKIAEGKNLEWLTPEFAATAKQHAYEMEEEYKAAVRGCDALLIECKRQKFELKEVLKSLPEQRAVNQDEVNAYRESVQQQLAEIEEKITLYTKAKKRVLGDPEADPNTEKLAHQGILKTLEQMKKGESTVNVLPTDNWTKQEYNLDQKAGHFDRVWEGVKVPRLAATSITGGASSTPYEAMPSLAKGQFREYTLSYHATVQQNNAPAIQDIQTAHFIEERNVAKDLVGAVDKNKVSYDASIKLSVSKFPSVGTKAELHQARVEFSLGMAAQLVAQLKEAPTRDKPIILRGSDPQELKYLWTALVTIGKNDPKMKFDESAIVVRSTVFDPEKTEKESKYLGLKSVFKEDSLYKKFEKNPAVQAMVAGIKAVSEEKAKIEEDKKVATKHVSSLFKDKFKETVENIEKREADMPTVPKLNS